MKKINLLQFGLGNVGRTLIREINNDKVNYKNLVYVGIADSERDII